MKLNQDSITVNMVVEVKSRKYMIESAPSTITINGEVLDSFDTHSNDETSLELIQELIASGDFTAKFIPPSFTSASTGTLIITEKE
jgi:hypothetical protein